MLKPFSKFITEATAASKKYDSWLNKNDNHHLGSSSEDIDRKLSTTSPIKRGPHLHRAITNYTFGSGINRKLIEEHKAKKDKNSTLSRHSDNDLDEATLHSIGHEMHLYSGIGFDPREHQTASNKGHALLHLPAYTSTTHDKRVASNFASPNEHNEQHILHIHTKPYDSGVFTGDHSAEQHEHETILPRHTTLKVNTKPDIYHHGGGKDAVGNQQPAVKTHIWHATIHYQSDLEQRDE